MNDILSRLLSAQPMDQGTIGAQMAPVPTFAQPSTQQQTVAQIATSDAEKRRQQIASREEARQKQAREKLANRQADMQRGPETPMESDNPRGGDEPLPPGYETDDLFSAASDRAQSKIGSIDRKPMTEWDKKDWGEMLVNIGSGFANAKDGQFSSGLAGGVQGMTKGFKDQDKRAQDFNDKQLARMEALEDMQMEDQMRQRRTGDERAYDQGVRRDEREYRSGERQQDRLHDDRQETRRRNQAITDRDEERTYGEGKRREDREYAEKVAIAANSRADAKDMREAAAKNGQNYSDDYVKLAGDLNKARIENGGEPMTQEELDAIIIPQLQRAYGIGGLGATGQNMLPQNQTLGSGY